MAEFKGLELPVGSEVEVLVHTHSLGVWGRGDEYYGLAFRGVVKRFESDVCIVQMTTSGFYGAYDYPSVPITGAPITVVVDPEKVTSAEWSGDLFRISLGK